MKNILIIGLGRFGSAMVKPLFELGNQIVVCDTNEENISRVLEYTAGAKIGDCTNENFIRSLGVEDFDLVFVTIGESLQDSLVAVTLLKDNGAKCIFAKAGSDMHEKLLLRLGADKVYIVYRRSMEELPARREEVEHAEEEGIEFLLLNNPVEILGYENPDDRRDPRNGFVTGMKCIKMQLGEPDERGRRRPIPIEGSEFVLDVDTVIISIGTSPNPLIKSTTAGLEVNKRGGIIVEEDTGATTKEGVYAGGDAVTGAATVISAMGAGKTAAKAIDEYLSNK